MMDWSSAFDDEPQPRTLEGWLRRQKRDLLLLQCASHARLDEHFDAHQRRLELDARRIAVDMQR